MRDAFVRRAFCIGVLSLLPFGKSGLPSAQDHHLLQVRALPGSLPSNLPPMKVPERKTGQPNTQPTDVPQAQSDTGMSMPPYNVQPPSTLRPRSRGATSTNPRIVPNQANLGNTSQSDAPSETSTIKARAINFLSSARHFLLTPASISFGLLLTMAIAAVLYIRCLYAPSRRVKLPRTSNSPELPFFVESNHKFYQLFTILSTRKYWPTKRLRARLSRKAGEIDVAIAQAIELGFDAGESKVALLVDKYLFDAVSLCNQLRAMENYRDQPWWHDMVRVSMVLERFHTLRIISLFAYYQRYGKTEDLHRALTDTHRAVETIRHSLSRNSEHANAAMALLAYMYGQNPLAHSIIKPLRLSNEPLIKQIVMIIGSCQVSRYIEEVSARVRGVVLDAYAFQHQTLQRYNAQLSCAFIYNKVTGHWRGSIIGTMTDAKGQEYWVILSVHVTASIGEIYAFVADTPDTTYPISHVYDQARQCKVIYANPLDDTTLLLMPRKPEDNFKVCAIAKPCPFGYSVPDAGLKIITPQVVCTESGSEYVRFCAIADPVSVRFHQPMPVYKLSSGYSGEGFAHTFHCAQAGPGWCGSPLVTENGLLLGLLNGNNSDGYFAAAADYIFHSRFNVRAESRVITSSEGRKSLPSNPLNVIRRTYATFPIECETTIISNQ